MEFHGQIIYNIYLFFFLLFQASIESEQAARHSLLLQCKLNNILIPIKSGSLDDIDEDGGDESMEMSASQPSHIIYEKEAAIGNK